MNHRNTNLISSLQKNTSNIRNFCILAHVDHGKTTLADTLLATNGIISNRMSGKLRYMDSRQDEQERGITMKSSAISLIHTNKQNQNYVINLIDSPGHVDFSTEVSTAIRLCDGAIILIDVCEGICPQTHAVLRQASLENLRLILVLNKIDRLITELKMTPLEAYYHLADILTQFNAIVAQQYTSLLLSRFDSHDEAYKESENENDNNEDETVEWNDDIDESKLYFSPKYNNVFFSSAIDSWGFGIGNFADIYAQKLGFKKDTLLKTLWGDYYMNAKTKRIMKNAQENAKKPLFVQLVLDNIWQIYDAFYTRRDPAMIQKILTSLNIKIPPRDLKYTDSKTPLQSLFTNWLPLGRNILEMIIDVLPSPNEISSEKVEHLISNKLKPFKYMPRETQKLKEDFLSCSSDESKPVIVFISKMFVAEKDCIAKKPLTLEDIALKREAIRQLKLEELNNNNSIKENQNQVTQKSEEKKEEVVDEPEEEQTHFLAFARVFSGTLKKGQTLFVLSPKHNCEDFVNKNVDLNSSVEELQSISKHVTKFTVGDIYLMTGRDLQLIDEVGSGNIVAIGGLQNYVSKSATLSSTPFCPSFTSMYMQTAPIVRVAIEPKNPSKMNDLLKGLRLLNQADPCVEIMVQENGEHILCTAGEVHLQRCIDDLVQRFALVDVNVSRPIIPFKETIIEPPKFDYLKEKITFSPSKESTAPVITNPTQSTLTVVGPDGLVEVQSQDKRLNVSIRAKPLPIEVTRFLENNSNTLKLLHKFNQENDETERASMIDVLKKFKLDLNTLMKTCEEEKSCTINWTNYLDRIVSFGPNRSGANLLINKIDMSRPIESIWSNLDKIDTSSIKKDEFENHLITGFQIASLKGPLCEEPMQGVAFLVEKCQVNSEQETNVVDLNKLSLDDKQEKMTSEENEKNNDAIDVAEKIENQTKRVVSLSSLCMSLTKEACRKAFQAQPQRLPAAMYKCTILTVNSEAMGKLYAVLGKRNAKILDETIKDGTSMFMVTAQLPVADSFGLADEIRKKTSGLASPHIEFSNFETIEIDPFWEPKTEEELLLFGDKADFENQAKKYMNEIRKRKGLFVKEKLVEHSEKQRTLIK